ncbi:MAG: T9SS type A sorting domain-containing protein [Nitrososphaerales archaeon]
MAGAENDSTVVLDSIAYRISTDRTRYSMTDCCIPVKFEYSNTTDDTLHLVSGSGNIVLMSFSDSLGNEFMHYVYGGTSHYYIEPLDTLMFSDTASSGVIEWRPGTYTARGKPDIWNTVLPYAEVTVFIGGFISVGDVSKFPQHFAFHQVYPNPFNPTTTIESSMPRAAFVTLTVYDVMGRKVETILKQHMEAGYHTLQWNATDVPSGIYFIRMVSGDFSQVRKAMVLR